MVDAQKNNCGVQRFLVELICPFNIIWLTWFIVLFSSSLFCWSCLSHERFYDCSTFCFFAFQQMAMKSCHRCVRESERIRAVCCSFSFLTCGEWILIKLNGARSAPLLVIIADVGINFSHFSLFPDFVKESRWLSSLSFYIGAQMARLSSLLRLRPSSRRPSISTLLPSPSSCDVRRGVPCCDGAALITGSWTVCGSRYVIILQPGGRAEITQSTSAMRCSSQLCGDGPHITAVQVFRRCPLCLNTGI